MSYYLQDMIKGPRVHKAKADGTPLCNAKGSVTATNRNYPVNCKRCRAIMDRKSAQGKDHA